MQNLRCEKARKRQREEALSKKRKSREAKKRERAIMQRCEEARISATLGSEHPSRRGEKQERRRRRRGEEPSIAEISASRLSRCSASWLPQFFSASRSHVVASSRRRFVTSSRPQVAPFISCVSAGALKDRKTFFAITRPKLPKKAVVVS